MSTLTGGGNATPSRWASTQPMRTRPTRPLPSPKGWMLSNCACRTAAWVTGSSADELANATKSAMSAGTSSGGGGT